MFSPKMRSRAVATLVMVSFLSLLAVKALPLAAQAELKKPKAIVGAQSPVPGFVEQVNFAGKTRGQQNRLLPSLLGLAVAGAVVAVLVLTVFKKTGYNPHIIPAEFIKGVRNRYFPLVLGRTRHYAVANGDSGDQLTVTATANTKLIMGVLCIGVQDRGLNSERLFEDTWRWYAQNQNGNVWLFAQETKKYDYNVVTEDWSWQAGANGAKPGIVMPGRPQDYLNKEYQEEFVAGVAEDKAQVLSLNETVTVPYGTFSGCLKIKVTSGRDEYRYYASGIGLILSETVAAGGKRMELVSISNE